MTTQQTTQDQDQDRLYPVKEWHMPEVDARLASLNRRAARLGLTPLAYTVDHTEQRDYYKDTVFGREKVGTYTVYYLRITGDAPRWRDYTFIATLEHTPDGTIIRQVPNHDVSGVDWAMWREAMPWCQHCQTARRRNDTFLVYRDTDGAVFQVGRNCLQDFMGKDADLQAKAADLLTLFADYIRSQTGNDDGPRSARDHTLPLEYYLSYVAASIRVHGWVSAKEAQATNDPCKVKTAHTASEYLWQDEGCNAGPDCRNREHSHITRTDADMARVDKAIAWCDALAERYDSDPTQASDFDHNMVIATRAHTVTPRTMGIAAYAVEASIRAEAKEAQRQAERATRVNAPYPAAPGQRVKGIKATVLDKRSIDGSFGATILHTLLTTDGYTLKWFASREDLPMGATVTMDATIKKHEVYKEWHSTQVTRCTVKES